MIQKENNNYYKVHSRDNSLRQIKTIVSVPWKTNDKHKRAEKKESSKSLAPKLPFQSVFFQMPTFKKYD